MSKKRNSRLSGEMKKVIADIIRKDVKDPRISDLMSVTDVNVTDDLKFAKVFISVYGDYEPTLEALQSAKGFIRREVGRNIKMRITPELIFVKDDSIEKGIYMSSLINKVINDQASNKVINDDEAGNEDENENE